MQRTVKDARLIFKPCARYLPTPVRTPLTIPYPCSYSGNSVGRNPFEFPLVILSDSSSWITNWIITRDYYDRFVKFEHDSKYYSREFLEFEFFRKRVLFLYFKQSEYWCCAWQRGKNEYVNYIYVTTLFVWIIFNDLVFENRRFIEY